MGNNKNQKQYVVGIGEVLLDCFGDDKRLGGAPMIFTYHAAQSGHTGVMISAIGDDDAGRKIEKDMDDLNIKHVLPKVDKPSGLVKVVTHDDDPDNPDYDIDIDSAWTEIPYTDELDKIAQNTCAVYFGPLASYNNSTSKHTIDRFLKAVPEDCYKIFDVNLRKNPDKNLYDDDTICAYLENCDVLKVNLAELDYVCDINNIYGGERKRCRDVMEHYKQLKYLIVTMGEDGSSVFWRNADGKISFSSLGMPIKVENTVGAGDALAGAFIGEILRNKKPVQAHHTAVQRAAIVCKAGVSMPQVIQPDIFISYSRKDEAIVAHHFCKCFEENNWSVWRDKDHIHHGDLLDPTIEQAIKNCGLVVYFSSKNANKSKWVTREIQIALENDKKIIPIKLDDAPYNKNVNALLKDVVHEDFSLTGLFKSLSTKLNN